MQILVSGSARPLVGQAGVSFTKIAVTDKENGQALPDDTVSQSSAAHNCNTEFIMDFCTTHMTE